MNRNNFENYQNTLKECGAAIALSIANLLEANERFRQISQETNQSRPAKIENLPRNENNNVQRYIILRRKCDGTWLKVYPRRRDNQAASSYSIDDKPCSPPGCYCPPHKSSKARTEYHNPIETPLNQEFLGNQHPVTDRYPTLLHMHPYQIRNNSTKYRDFEKDLRRPDQRIYERPEENDERYLEKGNYNQTKKYENDCSPKTIPSEVLSNLRNVNKHLNNSDGTTATTISSTLTSNSKQILREIIDAAFKGISDIEKTFNDIPLEYSPKPKNDVEQNT